MVTVEMCVYDAMAAILNNLHILKMLKVSHLAPYGFIGISTFILKKNPLESCIMSQNKINQGCCVCL